MKAWKNAIVAADTSLEEAIKILDTAALRIVLVVDDQRRLLGTLTDGDVRRALIRHELMTVPVHQVMNASPRVAGRDWSKDRMLRLMEKCQLLQLPIVDGQQRLIGLENLHDMLSKPVYDNPVFLMAGGLGKRLRPLTCDCPKPLLKVGGKPILELILEGFRNAGFHRFFISTHYMPEKFQAHFGDGSQWDVSIQYIHEDEPLGTGGALSLLPHENLDLPVFVMNGDLLTTVNFQSLLEFHQKHDSIATMCVRQYEYQVPYGVIQNNGDYIHSIVEKPVQTFSINAGIYVLSPELVKSLSPGTPIDMPALLEQVIAKDQAVTVFPIHEYWLDIGRMEDFERAQVDNGGILNG